MARISVDLSGARPAEAVDLPTVPPGLMWLYKAHPNRWDVIEGKVRPMLGKLKAIPGVNEVTDTGDYRPAQLVAESKGWVILDSRCGVDYLDKVPVKGGYAYLSIWTETFPGETDTTADMKGYCEFLDQMVAEKHIKPPTIVALRAVAKRYERTAARPVKNAAEQTKRAGIFAERLAIINAEIAKLEKALEAKRAPKRATRKRKPKVELTPESGMTDGE